MKQITSMRKPRRAITKRILGRRTLLIFALLAVGFGGTGLFFFSGSSSALEAAQKQTPDRQTDKMYRATKKIILDKQTGQMRMPNAEEIRKTVEMLKRQTSRSTENLRTIRNPNGGVAVDLSGRFGGVWLSRRNADGRLEAKCVSSLEEGAEFLGLVVDELK